jgi:hypothetical protein
VAPLLVPAKVPDYILFFFEGLQDLILYYFVIEPFPKYSES